ncbi:MAG: pyrroloquinoline quinone biosynthesis protein PqqE [Myxococcaceae bacterium]
MSGERPYTLIAELTYRCPLRCVYCSNPVKRDGAGQELDTGSWRRAIRDAASIGVLQLNLTGGEPLLRDDLELLVREAAEHELYSHLVTSGLPLTRERLRDLKAAGLDAVQLSVQDLRPTVAERIAGKDALAQKLEVAGWVNELELPLTLNVVLHRDNIGQVDELVALAERVGADRLELANTQYLGWALLNRDALMPSHEAIAGAREAAAKARERLRGKMEILFVHPDLDAGFPRACMDGWARRYIVIAPDGAMLPCHQARSITTLRHDNVRDRSVAEIWEHGAAFAAFRGNGWMSEPCRSCERRDLDFGGCRCQAFALLGDAAQTDPACSRSSRHGVVEAARGAAAQPVTQPLVYRRVPQ